MNMSKSSQSEERFPLLLLFLEDGQRSSRQNKKILIDKGRYQGITSGASTLITQWPGHIASCLITAALIGISIIIVGSIVLAFSMRPGINNLTAECKRHKIYQNNESASIHLTHGPNAWNQKQIEILEQIARNYPQSQIELILIRNTLDFLPKFNEIGLTTTTWMQSNHSDKFSKNIDTPKSNATIINNSSTQTTEASVVRESTIKEYDPFFPASKKNFEFDIKMGSKRLFEIFFPKPENVKPKVKTKKNVPEKPKTFQDILSAYPKIQIVNSTYEKIFENTPLYFTWHNTNEETRLFAIRVLQLWNLGGIAFSLNDMLESTNKSAITNSSSTETEKVDDSDISDIKSMITVGITNYKNLPLGLVTVDDEGFHMETKTPCHAFLGELLIELKKAQRSTKPSSIIQKTLHRFCLKGAVDDSYCNTING